MKTHIRPALALAAGVLCQAAPAAPPGPHLPQTLEETLLLHAEISWDFGDVAPHDWRNELVTSDPTARFDLRWKHAGPAFDGAALRVWNENGNLLGEVPIPTGAVQGDGFRYASVSVGDLPGQPTLSFRLVVTDADGDPLVHPPSNALQLTAESPADPFLYTPFFIDSVKHDCGIPGLAGSVWCQASLEERTWFTGARRFDGGAGLIASGDRWHIGSNTKAFTCTLLGILIQAGTPLPGTGAPLDWDTPVSDVFPEWSAEIHPRFQSTTMRHFACHRSGMRMTDEENGETRITGPGSKNENPRAFRSEMTKRLITRQHREAVDDNEPPTMVVTSPGGKWEYGHGNYIVLPAVIERLLDVDFEQAMQTRLFTPLGITTAAFGMPVDVTPYQPHGHRREGGFSWEIIRDNYALEPVWNAAGGLHLSQADWLKFCRLHLTGSEGTLTLQPATLAELHTPHPPDPAVPSGDPSYGWGWGIGTEPGGLVLGHDGTFGRFYARHTVHTGRGFAVVSAANMGPGAGFGDLAVSLLHNHLIEKSIIKVTESTTVPGSVSAESGRSNGITASAGFGQGVDFDVVDSQPIDFGGGFLAASLVEIDGWHRGRAMDARRPRPLEFRRIRSDLAGMRFSSEDGYDYDLYRSGNLTDWEFIQRFTGGAGASEVEFRSSPSAEAEFFQLREAEP